MSAIDKWYDKLDQLCLSYNILVTLHPWTQDHYIHKIKATEGVQLIEDANLLPYIMLSDICIGDTSSVLAECAALNKPIVRFVTESAPRSLSEIEELLTSVSVTVRSFEDLISTLPEVLHCPFPKRDEAVRIMFDDLDGRAGYRAAQEIIRLLPELKI
jgi:CDP-glycerol glycerophosphotransferase (TagB/SpsB family)